MKCLSEAICSCDTADDISFNTVMPAEGIKFVLTIRALLDAADPLLSCLSHKVILQELMYLPCVCLELGAT